MTMKKLFFFLMLLIPFATKAQESKLGPETSIVSSSKIGEKLVALALSNPDNNIIKLQTGIAENQLSRAKGDWLNTIGISGNLNQFSIDPAYKNYSLYFPKYNFGISLPLGIFVSQPNNVKIARKNVQIAQETEKSKQQAIKEQVLSLYQDYLMYTQLLVIQTQAAENEYTFYKQAEQKFKNGEIQMADYTSAAKNYNAELTQKIKVQHDLNVTQLQLEQFIGTSLDGVLAQYQQQK